jgi:hypothetical protein
MKVNNVSAFRVKRGLRRVSGAGPQVAGHPPQTTDERKTVTMKTFILRQAKCVEPQNHHQRSVPDGRSWWRGLTLAELNHRALKMLTM